MSLHIPLDYFIDQLLPTCNEDAHSNITIFGGFNTIFGGLKSIFPPTPVYNHRLLKWTSWNTDNLTCGNTMCPGSHWEHPYSLIFLTTFQSQHCYACFLKDEEIGSTNK